jgi:hypothetical protein
MFQGWKLSSVMVLAAVGIACGLFSGCQSTNHHLDPQRVEHASPEHGNWREVSKDSDTVGELHFHPGKFSVTFIPLESFRDYWGTYSFDPKSKRLEMKITGGIRPPKFKQVTVRVSMLDANHLELSGVALDYRRPDVVSFKFARAGSD